MAGIAEMLVGGGVAAILAAAIGGGLKAFDIQMPVIPSLRRQILLGVAGIALVGLGLYRGPAPATDDAAHAAAAPGLPAPRLEGSGATMIDFRSSDPGDRMSPGHGGGVLLVTTDLALRSLTEPARRATWTGTTGLLRIGGEAIPFRAVYFTNLGNTAKPWLGEGAVNAGPATIKAGAAIEHDVMFAPQTVGAGAYRWGDFVKAVSQAGAVNPLFEIKVATAVGETQGAPILLRCTARIDQMLGDIRKTVKKASKEVFVTAQCDH